MPVNLSHLTTPADAFTQALFLAATALTLGLLLRAVQRAGGASGLWLAGAVGWLAAQAVLAHSGVYQEVTTVPPRLLMFGIAPAVLILAAALRSSGASRQMHLTTLTALSSVRVLVEVVLYRLASQQLVPELMTFAGYNVDILAGLTAPVVAYAAQRGWVGRRGLLAWHLLGLGLLLTIIALAFLSAPSPVQRLAFEQPNVAVLQFPFVWLPTFIVPVVLFTHLAALRQLSKLPWTDGPALQA